MIEDEMISYTSKSGTDLQGTVGRGANNSTAVAHALGKNVYIQATTTSGDTGSVANGASKSVSWTATSDFPSYYSASAVVQISANDGQAATMLGSASTTLALDTKAPTVGSPVMFINASTTPAVIVFSTTDDSSLEMKVGLAEDLSDGSYVSYSATTTATLVSDPDTVYVLFRDAKGNVSATSSATTLNTPSGFTMLERT